MLNTFLIILFLLFMLTLIGIKIYFIINPQNNKNNVIKPKHKNIVYDNTKSNKISEDEIIIFYKKDKSNEYIESLWEEIRKG